MPQLAPFVARSRVAYARGMTKDDLTVAGVRDAAHHRRGGRRWARWAVLAVLALLLTVGWWLRNAAVVATGFAARRACTAVFLSDLEPDRVLREDLALAVSYGISLDVDREHRTVVAKAHLGLARRCAVFVPGRGAVLANEDADGCPVVPAPVDSSDSRPPVPAAVAEAASDSALAGVLSQAFVEPDRQHLRNTRAVAVVQDGRLLAARYAPGVGPQTPLLGWSMTKSVLNALVGIAVHDGRIRIGDRAPIAEWDDPADPRHAITYEDLLRMRTGLRFTEAYDDPFSDISRMLFREPDMAAFAVRAPIEVPVGSRWQYSSGTSLILTRALQRALGVNDLATFARERLFHPLGIRSAVIEEDASGTIVASSLMWATTRDWIRFGELFLADGVWQGRRILPEGWVSASMKPTASSRIGSHGAHWWTNAGDGKSRTMPTLPADAFFANGFEGQWVLVIPSRRCVIARLGVSMRGAAFPMEEFAGQVLAALP